MYHSQLESYFHWVQTNSTEGHLYNIYDENERNSDKNLSCQAAYVPDPEVIHHDACHSLEKYSFSFRISESNQAAN